MADTCELERFCTEAGVEIETCSAEADFEFDMHDPKLGDRTYAFCEEHTQILFQAVAERMQQRGGSVKVDANGSIVITVSGLDGDE